MCGQDCPVMDVAHGVMGLYLVHANQAPLEVQT